MNPSPISSHIPAEAVALVTGAGGGIGAALTAGLLARGVRVLATDLRRSDLEAAAQAGSWSCERAALGVLDVSTADSWNEALSDLLARWGRLDLLFNVAGYLRPGRLHEVDPQDITRHLNVNVAGTLLGIRLASPHMIKRGGGHIVNFGSMSSLAPVPGLGLYSASKYAVRACSLVAAEELLPHGVAVTVVCPDAVRTPMLTLQADHREAAMTFSGSFWTPEQVANVVLDRGLRKRPLELWIPTRRGWAARCWDLFPGMGFRLSRLLWRKGRAKQKQWVSPTDAVESKSEKRSDSTAPPVGEGQSQDR